MHEVDDIWVIIIDRSSIVQDVSLAARPILLVLLHHLLVTLTRRVIVRVLGEVDHRSGVLSGWLFIRTQGSQHLLMKLFLTELAGAIVMRISQLLFIRFVGSGHFPVCIDHSLLVLCLVHRTSFKHLEEIDLHRGRCSPKFVKLVT